MAVKGYYGLGARTYGNPGGATSGDGSFNGGGGGGVTPTLSIVAGTDGIGTGYSQTFCGVPIYGVKTFGAWPPFATPDDPGSIGTNVATSGPAGFSFLVFGGFAQNSFTSLTIIEFGLTLLTATADFFTNGGGCGPDAVWTWFAPPPLVVGNSYRFVFV
jgi:hypothetical protein